MPEKNTLKEDRLIFGSWFQNFGPQSAGCIAVRYMADTVGT
jgi:hypothetical protein